MKRARSSGGSVTGGSGDVKPQIMTLDTGTAGALNDYVVNRIQLPVSRIGSSKTKATIVEFLSVDWYLNVENNGDNDADEFAFLTTSTTRADADGTSLINCATDITSPNTLAFCMYSRILATTGVVSIIWPIHIDLTDSNGNGVLIATDSINIVGGSIGGATAGSYIAKVLYRLVEVGIVEYVGIVQSQQ